MQSKSWGGRLACPAFILLVALVAGCTAPNEQLTSCQADKEQLLVTIRQQRDSNRAMQTQVASLEARLDEAEKELARRSVSGSRLSSRPVEVEPLPWRSPR
jgi:septal ring factor EnvC (AmiA/AmiB activator)